MRYLGIDFGSKKVGLALSDEAGTMGFPHSIVPNTPSLAGDIAALAEKEGVGMIVIGESRDFAGNDNPIAAAARDFAATLAARTGLPVAWEPEMLTSREARRAYEPVGKTRAPRIHAAVDASAAALILTSYLSKNQRA